MRLITVKRSVGMSSKWLLETRKRYDEFINNNIEKIKSVLEEHDACGIPVENIIDFIEEDVGDKVVVAGLRRLVCKDNMDVVLRTLYCGERVDNENKIILYSKDFEPVAIDVLNKCTDTHCCVDCDRRISVAIFYYMRR